MDVAAILARHNLTGGLTPATGNRWLLHGERLGQGVTVQIEGEPDEAFIDMAAGEIVKELSADRIGR